MTHRLFFRRLGFIVLVSVFLCLLCIAPAHAYYFGDWSTDGYVKSQFGIFTEKKPFNKAQFGGSDDNISTARQTFRWNLNGQISKSFALRAEVLAAWEPEYPGEKGAFIWTPTRQVPSNYYNSFDWRELTIEYKPNYSHSIKFGRQIVNWGEAVSGRVMDQCNPDDSRAASGFVNLEERYMPLWMFRGQHDFYEFHETSIEWVVAPIWQADRYEHGRSMTADTPVGDAKTTNALNLVGSSVAAQVYRNDPSARFVAKRENRVEKIWGGDISINLLGLPGSVLGAPYSTGYHASDITAPGSPMQPLTAGQAAYLVSTYVPGSTTAFINQHPDANFVILSESPTFLDHRDYADHNFKNTRWGFKTKSQVGNLEAGVSFFQGPTHNPITKVVDYTPSPLPFGGYVVYQYQYPRYDTYGLYGNYSIWGTKFLLEAAYQPGRFYHKDLMGIGFGSGADAASVLAQRLDNMEAVDTLVTLWGVSREQNISFLNEFTPFSINLQYTNTFYLEDTDGLVGTVPFFMELDQMTHSFLLSVSTAYSYNKYRPSLTMLYYPEGAGYVSLGFTYVPDGFNSRLSLTANVSNYWTGPEFATGLSLYDNNDSVTVGFQYNFY